MYIIKTLTILIGFASFAAIKAQTQCNSTARIDDYNDYNRRQNANNVLKFDTEIANFKQVYTDRLDTINTRKDMLIDSLNQFDEYLDPLLVLGDFTKSCVNKYRSLVPTVAATKSAMDVCYNTASNQLANLVSAPSTTSRNLQNYYSGSYENQLSLCNQRFPSANVIVNKTRCIADVVQDANKYTISSQKTFNTQMDAAHCSGNANIKKALDCSFSTQTKTISLISQSKTSINRCIKGLDGMSAGYSCNEAYYTPKSDVQYNSRTMANPLYGRQNFNSNCLTMLFY